MALLKRLSKNDNDIGSTLAQCQNINDLVKGLTLIQRQSENGIVMTMRRTDKAVKTKAVKPGPSGSSENKQTNNCYQI